ncbi:hypothetical protein SAMN05421636_107247 [Pricia antarctica]|uniref:Uncharacterized protein n=1 Tax=Pricia antarctica TaxID=641691 RepID=A0A1G7FRQ3_9FLAO|nr:hypothetical protein [Pricia antarctica]SDE78544.1 hypothetical protein SAMN05421636_107247 [Pricia antarctica]
MKKVIFLLLLLPLMAVSQSDNEYMIFETARLTPNPTQIAQFEKGLMEHNKKFHGDGPYGARIYWISSGPNTGSYHWSMGPLPWSALDGRPGKENGHDADWDTNVLAYVTPESGATSYWKNETDLSRFSKDFTINKMLVDYYDITRGKGKEAMALVEKVKKVYAEKMPDETFGVYSNELGSTKEGRDLAVISFFDKLAWIGQDNGFPAKYDEVHGTGGFEQFLKDWYAVTEGGESELWMYRADLSGISGDVKVADRQ